MGLPKAQLKLWPGMDSALLPVPLAVSLVMLASSYVLSFQNNLNLQRDLAVLIAQQFKSNPVREPVFVLHR